MGRLGGQRPGRRGAGAAFRGGQSKARPTLEAARGPANSGLSAFSKSRGAGPAGGLETCCQPAVHCRYNPRSAGGAVAQLGEHHVRNVGVEGSNPFCSTTSSLTTACHAALFEPTGLARPVAISRCGERGQEPSAPNQRHPARDPIRPRGLPACHPALWGGIFTQPCGAPRAPRLSPLRALRSSASLPGLASKHLEARP